MKPSLSFQLKTICALALMVLNANQFSLAAEAVSNSVEVKHIHVGFDGLYKVGRWVPISVELSTRSPIELQLSVVALSPDGNPTETPSKVYRFSQQGTYQLYSVFKAGLLDCPLKIRLRDAQTESILYETLYSPQSTRNQFTGVGLKQSANLWATIGEIPGFDPAHSSPPTLDDLDLDQFITAISDLSLLPETSVGYDSLDTIIINAEYPVGVEKNQAIREWVVNGGHLVVCVGTAIEAYQESELFKWVPVKIRGKTQVRDLSSLELYAAVRSRIRGVANASRIEIETGEVLASSLNGPVLVRIPFGLGVVTFLTLDLKANPLVNWDGLTKLCPKLANRTKKTSSTNQVNAILGKRLSQTGISELETQIFHSQQNFAEVRRPSHWWVMGLILLYLFLIGVLDFILVHHILKKPHFTWVTFPVMVLLAAVWGIASARSANGDQLNSTQLNVVDYDASEGHFRGRSYLNLYSPDTRRYQVEIQSILPVLKDSQKYFQTQICWNGLPETTFAGMYRSAEGTLTGPSYQFSNDSQSIKNLPILKWGTKSLRADWTQKKADLVSSNLIGNNLSQLSGNLTHHFSSPLKDWVLAYGNRIYLPVVNPEHLEDSYFSPHQPLNFNSFTIESRNIKGYLTRSVSRRFKAKGQKTDNVITQQTDYNPFSKDTYEILKMLTYHKLSGGFGYTGLSNFSSEQLDLTEQLRLGRAVLFARMDTALSQTQLDEQILDPKNQSTFVRIVIPVKNATEVLNELPSLEDEDKDKKPKEQQNTPSGSDNE
ncbi:hypothetical protein [uncultured Gimesia sp.]|uniref:hypothetical protein n=1 Tax=uncultured Gimesia sp. TaxID=1678688 RepID=UPI0026196197|nr:hypothetical protein [uncultured Gimesia sp.]